MLFKPKFYDRFRAELVDGFERLEHVVTVIAQHNYFQAGEYMGAENTQTLNRKLSNLGQDLLLGCDDRLDQIVNDYPNGFNDNRQIDICVHDWGFRAGQDMIYAVYLYQAHPMSPRDQKTQMMAHFSGELWDKNPQLLSDRSVVCLADLLTHAMVNVVFQADRAVVNLQHGHTPEKAVFLARQQNWNDLPKRAGAHLYSLLRDPVIRAPSAEDFSIGFTSQRAFQTYAPSPNKDFAPV